MTYFDNDYDLLTKKVTSKTEINPSFSLSEERKVPLITKVKKKANKNTVTLLFPIFGGICGMLLSVFIWIESVRILKEHYQYDHKYAYMALLVSLSVGLLMRWAGAKNHKLAIVSVMLTFIGSLLGTLLGVLVHFVEVLDLSYFEVFDAFDFSFIVFLLQDRFAYLDIIFYLTSANIAYWLVKRKK